MERIFGRVIDTPRMLRTFVQMVRSGVTRRQSFGSVPAARDPPLARSLAPTKRSSRPRSATSRRWRTSSGWCTRSRRRRSARRSTATCSAANVDRDALPPLVQQFEAFKAGDRATVPDVPFQMLTALDLGPAEWREIARQASWQMTRMNLNTFARHGVFEEAELTDLVASRLGDPEAIAAAGVLPVPAPGRLPRRRRRGARAASGRRARRCDGAGAGERAGGRRPGVSSAPTSRARCGRR